MGIIASHKSQNAKLKFAFSEKERRKINNQKAKQCLSKA